MKELFKTFMIYQIPRVRGRYCKTMFLSKFLESSLFEEAKFADRLTCGRSWKQPKPKPSPIPQTQTNPLKEIPNALLIYPNPTNGLVRIAGKSIVQVIIQDLKGKY